MTLNQELNKILIMDNDSIKELGKKMKPKYTHLYKK